MMEDLSFDVLSTAWSDAREQLLGSDTAIRMISLISNPQLEINPDQMAAEITAQTECTMVGGQETCRDPESQGVIIIDAYNANQTAQGICCWSKDIQAKVPPFLSPCEIFQTQMAEPTESIEPLVVQQRAKRARGVDEGNPASYSHAIYDLNTNILRQGIARLIGLLPRPGILEVSLRRIHLDTPVRKRDKQHPHFAGLDIHGTPYYIKRRQLHLAFLNPQGNFDANNTGLGEHADFGGQLVYVREVAEALGRLGVNVDIITRRFTHPRWPQFNDPEEILMDPAPGTTTGRVRILRIPAGPAQFLPKEKLWPHLEDWSDNVATWYEHEGQLPHATTGHYGDGGLAATRLAQVRGLPFATFTAHSLGAQKLDSLLLQGKDVAGYNFDRRIAAERRSMSAARCIITSTHVERDSQYGHPLYEGAIDLQRDSAHITTIPPGVNLEVFGADRTAPDEADTLAALQAAIERDIPPERRHLPIIVAAGRLDGKKNHISIVRAFAQHPYLRGAANLLLLLKGGPDAFRKPEETFHGEELHLARAIKEVMESAHMDGDCVIVPGLRNRQRELAAIYRYLGRTRQGIFCLAADIEPFGLMVLEAILAGIPAVSTCNGGPSESLQRDGQIYGLLMDPKRPDAIAASLYQLVSNPTLWLQLRDAGQQWVLDQYTWDRTAARYHSAVLGAIGE